MVTPCYQRLFHIGFQEARSHQDGCRRRKSLAALRRIEGFLTSRHSSRGALIPYSPWLPRCQGSVPFISSASPGCTVSIHVPLAVTAVGCVSQVRLSGERNVMSIGEK